MKRNVISIFLLVLLLVSCVAPAIPTAVPATPTATPQPLRAIISGPSLAIVNGTLIDGTGADPIKDAALIIQGERIVAVGTRSSISVPEGAQILDVKGATILPGFFNAHVHGAYNEVRLAAWAKEGVTTVRDLGARVSRQNRAIDDRGLSPHKTCGLVGRSR